MQHLFGLNELARAAGRTQPVIQDTEQLVNGHMLIAGMSGTGKSYQINRMLASAHRQGIEVDVFDVHEELHEAPGAVACKFSEATQLGFNPLVPSLDPHSGGIRRQIEAVVDVIGRTSRKLGPRQESALKYLLQEVYTLRGMYPDNPASWDKRVITEAEFDAITQERDYKMLRQCYPILRDVISYGERKLKALTFGSDNRAINALEKVERTTAKIHKIIAKKGDASTDQELENLQKQLDSEKADAVEAYANFIGSLDTGREYMEAQRYSNPETLKSLLERLQELQDGGIFRSNPPDWQGALTRVYQVGSLRDDERKLLFFMQCESILRRVMNAGRTDKVRHIILADEGHLYYDDSGDNIINRIAKEGRKFGLALIIGSQSPTHFSEDFVTNVGTIMLCGIHSSYWDGAVRKLRCDKDVLTSTRAREVVAIKFQRLGEADPRFVNVNVSQAVVDQAIAAAMAARRAAGAPA